MARVSNDRFGGAAILPSVPKLRIGILFGGRSTEHEVSVVSATTVLKALDPGRYAPVLIGLDQDGSWRIAEPGAELLPETVFGSNDAIAAFPSLRDGLAFLAGDGLAHNFRLIQDRFGDTCHVRELNVGKYPYAKLMELLVGIDYAGWVLLECRTNPRDRVAAMAEQREMFRKMIAAAS